MSINKNESLAYSTHPEKQILERFRVRMCKLGYEATPPKLKGDLWEIEYVYTSPAAFMEAIRKASEMLQQDINDG